MNYLSFVLTREEVGWRFTGGGTWEGSILGKNIFEERRKIGWYRNISGDQNWWEN